MINYLSLSKNAQFYILKKPLTKESIIDTFKDVSKERVGNYLKDSRKIKDSYKTILGNEVLYSSIAYKIEAEPSFLSGTNIKEKKYAYLLLIECDDVLVIFKKYIDSLDKYFSSFIEEFDYEIFCHFHGNKKPEYERVTMKSMSISNAVIRARSLEAKSLNGIISSNSSSRSIPSNFRMKVGEDSYTLTPSTSRVSHRDKKSEFEGLIDWVVEIKNEIKATTRESEFFSNFASPICLKDIMDLGHQVVAILIDLSEIENKFSEGTVKLLKAGNKSLTTKEINNLFNKIKSPILVCGGFIKFKGQILTGKITYSKNLITIRNSILDNITIIEDGVGHYTLGKYINREKPFSAVFDSPEYSYYSKSCFQDKKLINNIPSILKVFDDSYDFNGIKSEKEKPHASSLDRFPPTSLFRKVEDQYCKNQSVIICDDMNDEWADHIVIDTKSVIPSISFIHSKFVKHEAYGASAFHDVVAQALKNIGRTQTETLLYKSKYDSKWSKHYEGTNIPRVIGANSWTQISDALESVNQNPNAIKKIILATPFLSKKKLEKELNKLALGQKCKPHYIQLIWLINTFISSCKDFGVQAHILCKP